MPKLKTHSGAKKRFKVTATGKVKYQQTGKIPNYALGIVIGVVVITIVAFGYRT